MQTLSSPGDAVSLTVNGREHSFVLGHDLDASETLADVLRERLGLTGLKVACDEGACGACTVILDGRAVLSCMTLAVEAAGHDVLTIEGLADDDPVVQAFACQCEPGHGTALQCGFCTPGAVLTAKAFLAQNVEPTLDEVREALAGNLCRCGCYQGIARAVLNAAKTIREQGAAAFATAAGVAP
jgi:aerobic carbon-monoxide dehydrogenase small subunit